MICVVDAAEVRSPAGEDGMEPSGDGGDCRERIVIFQCGARVRMPMTTERPREGEAPPAIATLGIVCRDCLR
jgi:hypothetical protein